jgi:hypothetical protein
MLMDSYKKIKILKWNNSSKYNYRKGNYRKQLPIIFSFYRISKIFNFR